MHTYVGDLTYILKYRMHAALMYVCVCSCPHDCEVFILCLLPIIFHSVVMTAEDGKAALRTFDELSHLMTLIDPSSLEEQLHTAGLLPTDHPTSLTTGLVIEKLLKHIRSCVELKGAEMFISFINVLHNDGRYGILGDYLFGEMVYTCI